MSSTVGTCALCLMTTTLRDSHIIPRWAFTRARTMPDPSAAGTPGRPVDQHYLWIDENGARNATTQLTERLLCDSCERRFGLWEAAASRLTRQSDGSFPARSECVLVALAPGLHSLAALDADAILRFGTSVLWRASAAARFPHIVFGESYHDAFREYLLDANSTFPRGAVMSLKLIDPTMIELHSVTEIDSLLDCLVTHPAVHSLHERCRVYTFVVLGMHFSLALGEVPLEAAASCFARTKRVEIVDGTEFRDALTSLGVRGLERM